MDEKWRKNENSLTINDENKFQISFHSVRFSSAGRTAHWLDRSPETTEVHDVRHWL